MCYHTSVTQTAPRPPETAATRADGQHRTLKDEHHRGNDSFTLKSEKVKIPLDKPKTMCYNQGAIKQADRHTGVETTVDFGYMYLEN